MLPIIGYNELHWVWVFLTVLFAVIEVFTFGLVTVWFSLAAFLMIFFSLIFRNVPFVYQLMIFLALSAAMLVFTRPLAIKKFKMGKEKTNVDSLVGMHALVLKKVSEFDKGEVKLNGQIWSAKPESEGMVFEEGTKCEVVRIEGVHAIVKEQVAGSK